MSRLEIRQDICKLIDSMPYDNVDIAPIIEKYTAGKDIDGQDKARSDIRSVLTEMKAEGDIQFPDNFASISARTGGVYWSSSGLIRSTSKYEKQKSERVGHRIHIGGNFQGNFNAGDVRGSLNQENTFSTAINDEDKKLLLSLGVLEGEINELKTIASSSGDKTTFASRARKWMATVVASLVSRGVADSIPALMEYIEKLTT